VDLESDVELEALVAAVRTLPPKTQQVFILRKVYSWPVERIAERALLSEAAVLRHLATAARELDAASRACTRRVIEPSACPTVTTDSASHTSAMRAPDTA
jgi:DNA-directed RNA polymerase specialized sigma24 family protein